jgi:hypothetical protein
MGPNIAGTPDGTSWPVSKSSTDPALAKASPPQKIEPASRVAARIRVVRALDITLNYNRRSKESVNRTVICASALFVGVLLAVPARAQVALVVGSVRDQHGAVVEGAAVTAAGSHGESLATTATDASGTFAVQGENVASVTIVCRYCASRTLAIVPGEPVVAIVRRFDALFDDSPSPADLANLPYGHIESAMALHSFSLLQQSTGIFPGSQLSDRGLLPANALLIDAGVPNYDVVFGASPYDSSPAMYQQAGSIASAANAFLYGDRAGSGIVSLDPFGDGNANVALAGGLTTVRLASGSETARIAAGSSTNSTESRQRADAQLTVPLSSVQTLRVSGGTTQYRDYANPSSTLAGNFSFLNTEFDDAQPTIDLHTSFVADRGGYVASDGGLPIEDIWSDANFTAGLRTRGPIAAFADVSNRLSTGIYDPQVYQMPRIAGTLTQNRIDAGLEAVGHLYDVTAGVGFFGIGYTGGTGGSSLPAQGHLALPSLQVALFPGARWSAGLEASGSFTLPTLWERYGIPFEDQTLTYDRNSLYSATLSYTDNARIRISVEGATQRVTGLANGLVTSDGVSATWQIAPAVSLRAWTMYVDDSTTLAGQTPVAPIGLQTNVDAFWLTYDNGGAVRLDAIYRRDILDRQPYEHVDAAISGPIANHVRWFAGVEDRQHLRYLDVGLRFSP